MFHSHTRIYTRINFYKITPAPTYPSYLLFCLVKLIDLTIEYFVCRLPPTRLLFLDWLVGLCEVVTKITFTSLDRVQNLVQEIAC